MYESNQDIIKEKKIGDGEVKKDTEMPTRVSMCNAIIREDYQEQPEKER